MNPALRVTIVEDVPDDAELIALQLESAGYSCQWRRVCTEEDFLATLDDPPQLILADWALPRFSGLRALQLAKARDLDIPFIIVSGSIGEEAAADAMRQGAYDYILKDRPARLGQAVRHALDEKRLRDERRRSHDALIQLTHAVEQSPVSVIITDKNGDIEYVNPKFTEVSGYSSAEVRGRNPRILKSGVTPASEYAALWQAVTRGVEWRGEFHNRRKDGAVFRERAVISPLRDSSGAITHFLAVKEDVTAQRALESQLLQAQKMESVGRMAGGIAHDFNNLLTVINGQGDIALRKMDKDDPLREAVAAMREAGSQAAQLTTQLLAFSRRQDIAPSPLDLNELVRATESLLRRLLGGGIEFVAKLEPSLGRAMADRGQLQQVLVNMAVNARDAMPKGGTLTMETANATLERNPAEALAPGPYVLLTVSDSGTGMDEDTRSHIFEPFFTTKSEGRGTGLGLATAYAVVKQCGGDIEVRSEPGHGTQFRIRLPRTDAPVRDAAPGAPPPREVRTETGAGPARKVRVLLADDAAAVRRILAAILEEAGFAVVQANGGDEIRRLLAEAPVEVALVDLNMPGQNGLDAIREMRSGRPELKIALMSAAFQGSSPEIAKSLGVDAALGKPVESEVLVETVRRLAVSAPGAAA